jgi:hypothetical protein
VLAWRIHSCCVGRVIRIITTIRRLAGMRPSLPSHLKFFRVPRSEADKLLDILSGGCQNTPISLMTHPEKAHRKEQSNDAQAFSLSSSSFTHRTTVNNHRSQKVNQQ